LGFLFIFGIQKENNMDVNTLNNILMVIAIGVAVFGVFIAYRK